MRHLLESHFVLDGDIGAEDHDMETKAQCFLGFGGGVFSGRGDQGKISAGHVLQRHLQTAWRYEGGRVGL